MPGLTANYLELLVEKLFLFITETNFDFYFELSSEFLIRNGVTRSTRLLKNVTFDLSELNDSDFEIFANAVRLFYERHKELVSLYHIMWFSKEVLIQLTPEFVNHVHETCYFYD